MSLEQSSAEEREGWHCPGPSLAEGERVQLMHGDGGRLTRRLVRERIVRRLENPYLLPLDDAARLPRPEGPLAFTSDGFVVAPLLFPGGDIGSLAVYGTANDLAVAGATPLWLTLSFILEEGLPLAVLDRVMESVAAAAQRCGAHIVAGDTKVVPRGAADGMFIHTAGLGALADPPPVGPTAFAPNDEIVVSGPLGLHGLAVLVARERLDFDPPPRSDAQSLVDPLRGLRECLGPRFKGARDATRGGLAAVLHEWSEVCGHTLQCDEAALPTLPTQRGLCEVLGVDPLYFAGEGVFAAVVSPGAGAEAVRCLREYPETRLAAVAGRVQPRGSFPVVVQRGLGAPQPLEEPLSPLLPRIC